VTGVQTCALPIYEKMDRLTADVLKHLEELRRDTRVLRNDR
jgi:hypothetical protein